MAPPASGPRLRTRVRIGPPPSSAAAGVSSGISHGHAALTQHGRDPIDVEVVNPETEMVDGGCVRPGGAHAEELRSGADLKIVRHPLPADDGHAEETLIEVD